MILLNWSVNEHWDKWESVSSFVPPLKLTAGVSMQIAIDLFKMQLFLTPYCSKSPCHSDYLMKTLSVLLIEVDLSIITL